MRTRIVAAASWPAHRGDLAAVGAAVRSLRIRQPDVARTAVMTLVVITGTRQATDHAQHTIRELAERHPLHVVILQASTRGDAELHVNATVHRRDRAGAAMVCLTQVVVEVGAGGPALPALVAALRLPGVPVVAWFIDRLADSAEACALDADNLVIDSHQVTPPQVASLLALADRTPVTDLAWIRLQPWRQLVAGLFTTGDFAAFLPAVHRVQVAAGPEKALLVGWLASRLGLSPDRVEITDRPTISVRLHAHLNGVPALFVVESEHNPAEIVASAAVLGGPSHRRRLLAPRWSTADQVDVAILQPAHNRDLYRETLLHTAAAGYW